LSGTIGELTPDGSEAIKKPTTTANIAMQSGTRQFVDMTFPCLCIV
jgi:hypothetical protein